MDLFDLSGKTAVVTGGTRGIGLMIARGLLEAGARVYISSRKADGCAAAEAELSEYGPGTAISANLSTEAECLRLAREIGGGGPGPEPFGYKTGGTPGGPPRAVAPPAPGDGV